MHVPSSSRQATRPCVTVAVLRSRQEKYPLPQLPNAENEITVANMASVKGEKLRILLVGNGGREHTLAWKLAQSDRVECIHVVPGNGGTAG